MKSILLAIVLLLFPLPLFAEEDTLATSAGSVEIPGPAQIVADKPTKPVKIWSPRGKENKVLAEVKHGAVVTVLGSPHPDEAGKVLVKTADGVEGWVSPSYLSLVSAAPVVVSNGKKGTLTIPGPGYLDGRDLDAKVSTPTVNVWSSENKKLCSLAHGTKVEMLEPPPEPEARMKIKSGTCEGWVNVGFLNEKTPPKLP